MTITKAKMFKTAVVAVDVEGYKAGDIVAVEYVGKSSFGGFRFRVSAEYLGRPVVCLTDSELEGFVL